MRIALSATGPTIDDTIDPKFGRCQYFLFVDTETMEIESIQNDNARAGGGAGISSAQLVADKDVACVLTGNCGPKAFRVLSEADIKVITGCSGSAREAIERYKKGEFAASDQANVDSHFGTQ